MRCLSWGSTPLSWLWPILRGNYAPYMDSEDFFFFNTAKAELTASQTGVVCVCIGGRMQRSHWLTWLMYVKTERLKAANALPQVTKRQVPSRLSLLPSLPSPGLNQGAWCTLGCTWRALKKFPVVQDNQFPSKYPKWNYVQIRNVLDSGS